MSISTIKKHVDVVVTLNDILFSDRIKIYNEGHNYEEQLLVECIKDFEANNKEIKFMANKSDNHYEVQIFFGEYNMTIFFEHKELKVIGRTPRKWKKIFKCMAKTLKKINLKTEK